MTWRDDTDPHVVRDLDTLYAATREQAKAALVGAWRFSPFVTTLRTDGRVVVEAARRLADAQEMLSDPDVVAAAVVSTDRGHAAHWVLLRMQHRLGGPRLEVVTDYKRTGLLRKRVRFAAPVESMVGAEGPLARQFEIDADSATADKR